MGLRAVHQAVMKPKQEVAVVSTTLRQALELANRCREFGQRLGLGLGTRTGNPGSLVFSNGGGFGTGIRPLPADANRVRGFTANFLIVDEAARVADEV